MELEAEILPLAVDRPDESSLEALSAQSAIDALVRDLPPDQAEVVVLRVVGSGGLWVNRLRL